MMFQCSYTKNLKNLLLRKINQLKFSEKKIHQLQYVTTIIIIKKKSIFIFYFVTIVIDVSFC